MSYYSPKTKVFVSFDYDHDEDLKILFCGQAEHDDTPFEITDVSVKKARQKPAGLVTFFARRPDRQTKRSLNDAAMR